MGIVVKELSSLTEDDIIVRPVADDSGTVLIQAGMRVTQTIIRVLVKRGVTEVFVRDANAPDLDEEGEEAVPQGFGTDAVDDAGRILRRRIEEMEERMQQTFKYALDDPLMVALFRAVRDHLAKKIESHAA